MAELHQPRRRAARRGAAAAGASWPGRPRGRGARDGLDDRRLPVGPRRRRRAASRPRISGSAVATKPCTGVEVRRLAGRRGPASRRRSRARADHSSCDHSVPRVRRNSSAQRASPVRSCRNSAASRVPGAPHISSRAGWSTLPAISAASARRVRGSRARAQGHQLDRRLAHQERRVLVAVVPAVPGAIAVEQPVEVDRQLGPGGVAPTACRWSSAHTTPEAP